MNKIFRCVSFYLLTFLFGFSAQAACDSSMFAAGAGTDASPWQIATAHQLSNIRECLGSGHADKRFELTADIDIGTSTWTSGSGWLPIGNSTSQFYGRLNGNGYSVFGLTIKRVSSEYIGLFGYINGGRLTNLKIVNADIKGQATVGIAVGYLTNGAQLSRVQVSGVVAATNGGSSFSDTGGLAGAMYFSTSVIDQSSSMAEVSASGRNIGGLVGYHAAGTIRTSFSLGSVVNTIGTRGQIGGLTGRSVGGSVVNSWSAASVETGNQSSGDLGAAGFIGAIGAVTVENCFSLGSVTTTGGTTGGFIAVNSGGTVTNSFWNTETSGQASSVVGTGLTTAALKNSSNLTTWDFGSVWVMSGLSEGYPQLQWAHVSSTAPGAASPSGRSISTLAHLLWISEDSSRWAESYHLANDIDMSATAFWYLGKGWSPIGNSATKFTGSFNGHNLKLKGLFIRRLTEDNVGFFGFAQGTTMQNLTLFYPSVTARDYVGSLVGTMNPDQNTAAATVTAITVQGARAISSTLNDTTAVGGLIGQAFNSSLTNIRTSGVIKGRQRVGGVVGWLRFESALTNAIADVRVEANRTSSLRFFGGLIGVMEGLTGQPTLRNAVARGSVDIFNGTSGDNGDMGGAVGLATNASFIKDVYSNVSVIGASASSNGTRGTAGLVGRLGSTATVETSYSFGSLSASVGLVGGLIGAKAGSNTVTSCYWDVTTSGIGSDGATTGSAGGTGKSTTNMASPGTYMTTGWDFAGETANGSSQIWGVNASVNGGRPFLMIEGYSNTESLYRFTVQFLAYDSSVLSTQNIYWGLDATPPSASRTGYTFTGWNGSYTAVNANRTLTAQYTINQYTLSFNVDGGSAVSDITQNYASAVTAPTAPTKSGYNFVGWDPAVPSTIPAANQTHRAMWLKLGSAITCSYGSCEPRVSASGEVSYTVQANDVGGANVTLQVTRPNEAQWPVTIQQTRATTGTTQTTRFVSELTNSSLQVSADSDGHPTVISTATVGGKDIRTELKKDGELTHSVTGTVTSTMKSSLPGKQGSLDNQGNFRLSALLDSSQSLTAPPTGAYRAFIQSLIDGTSTSGFETYNGSSWDSHSSTLASSVVFPAGYVAEIISRNSKVGVKVNTAIDTQLRW